MYVCVCVIATKKAFVLDEVPLAAVGHIIPEPNMVLRGKSNELKIFPCNQAKNQYKEIGNLVNKFENARVLSVLYPENDDGIREQMKSWIMGYYRARQFPQKTFKNDHRQIDYVPYNFKDTKAMYQIHNTLKKPVSSLIILPPADRGDPKYPSLCKCIMTR